MTGTQQRIRIILGSVLAATSILPLPAQTPEAQITGLVSDASGAAVPGVQITVTNVGTRAERHAESNPQGDYTVPLLDPGEYQLSAAKAGFQKLTQSGIVLHVAQTARIDITMQVGAVTESVQVSSEAPLVDSETSSIGSVISNKAVLNLPLNNRNTLDFTLLAPGVVPSRYMSDSYVISPMAFLVNGGRANDSEVLTDGIAATTPEANNDQAVPVLPQVDAIQEFKVQTNSMAAEFGRTGGGVVNFVFKSGTNDFHGDVFEFLRNSALDSNNFFNNRAGINLASFRRHQFGGVVGGPVIIPHVFNGRNKLFFFGGFESLRASTGVTTTLTLPTALERAGNFSKTLASVGGACQPVNVYDPYSLKTAAGGGFTRTQFPGNIIPPSQIDPVAARMASFYPLPNNAGSGCAGTSNFLSSDAQKENINQPTGRVDYYITSKDRLFVRLSTKGDQINPINAYKNVATTSSGRITNGKNAATSYSRVLSPTLIAEIRFGLTRFTNIMPPAAGPNFDMASTLGWTGTNATFISQMTRPIGFPSVTATGYSALGTGQQPWSNEAGNSYQWAGSVTKIVGSHNFKAGFDTRILQYAGPNGFNASGVYAFTQSFTQGPNPTTAGPTSGNGLASLLTGLGTGSVQIIPRIYTSNNYVAGYFQDDYHVTKKLTLNLGLRYDLETGRSDRYNHLSWFNFTTRSPLAQMVPSLPNLRGGLEFPGVGGNPTNQFDLDTNNFGPRAGLAYSIDSRTVVRMGYGILYEPYSGRAEGSAAGYTGFSAITNWNSSLDGITPLNRLSNAFPAGLTAPTGSSQGLLTAVGTQLGATVRDGAFDRTARVGYIQQWNVTVQRSLTRDLALEVAYTGAKGTRLTDGGGFEEDQLTPAQLALGNGLLQSVPNPFAGIIQVGTLAGATTTAGQLLRPYPQYTGVLDFRPNAASSIYHALQAHLEKRLSHGVQFVASYTYSKSIDDSSSLNNSTQVADPGLHQNVYDRHADRSVSAQDVPHRLILSAVVELPFGRGKAFGSGWTGVTQALLGGWQTNGIASFESGLPLLVSNSSNNSQSYSSVQRPNVNGTSPDLPGGRPLQTELAQWFNTSVFSQPAAFTFGDASRVISSIRSDALKNLDMSFFKNFDLANEKLHLQFRAEFFNFLNHPEFAPPGGTFGASSFGVVSTQLNMPRQTQFGLKILF